MLSISLVTALAAVIPFAAAGDVFVHYMIQTLHDDHGLQDVQRAIELGVSAFALNVGTCPDDWCTPAIADLFAATEGTDFKIFFSMDHYSQPDPYAFTNLVNQYFAHPNYYRSGPDTAPMLSTFNDAGWGPDQWAEFIASLSVKPYFLPMFDQAEGYYTDPEAFWAAWADVLDGSFSWEQSWPGRSDSHANVTSELDEAILSVAHARGKAYMMGLSSLQYKHLGADHWFRVGDVVLPERMTQILSLTEKPDFVQVQTWNDAGESHYIGHLWHEGLLAEQLLYANQDEHPHQGWQSLVASFFQAFRAGVDASGMRPQDGSDVTGALWHHEFVTANSPCSAPPDGYGAAVDAVNWALVAGVEGLTVQVWSGGELIRKEPLSQGLNYMATRNVKAGEQVVEVIDSQGNIIAQGGQSTKGISAQDESGICNMNFQVAGLSGSVA